MLRLAALWLVQPFLVQPSRRRGGAWLEACVFGLYFGDMFLLPLAMRAGLKATEGGAPRAAVT